MSGPVTDSDVGGDETTPMPTTPSTPQLEITESHLADVAGLSVRRALPRRARRTIGAWCFLDHMGPTTVNEEHRIDIGPHPHMGLQTVTWLVSGELVHRDSLGSEQLIQPGQLNLMTAGNGVTHAEESTGTFRGDQQGVQLWIAQPESTRNGPAAFEHHATLPTFEVANGTATVLVGTLGDATSPARRDTDHVGVDLALVAGTAVLPVFPSYEYGLVVLEGELQIDGEHVTPGHLAYLGLGRDELSFTLDAPARAILIGGVPFDEDVLMWWNFVARTRDEVTAAYLDWRDETARFGDTASSLARIPARPPLWLSEPTA